MQFNSHLFLLLFLPVTVFLYFFVCKRWRKAANPILLGTSLLFYVYYSWVAAVYMLLDLALNYLLYRALLRAKQATHSGKKHLLWIGIVLNILSLFVFKYAITVVEAFGIEVTASFPLQQIIVPLGISFITFSKISFLVDTYKGENDQYNLIDYYLYILFFPKVISGPITKANTLIPQFHEEERKAVQWENMTKGLYGFSIGLAKKVLIADFLGILVDYCYSDVAACSGFEAILAIIAFSLQIFFDFSGYSDMAIGIARMMNFELPQNFNSPYKAEDIVDFWKRWHITLTSFLTQYIYYPLGGNRKGKWRQYLNILIVFAISGIWHGAGLTFLVWGLMHGTLSVLTRIIKPHLKWRWKPGAVFFTFVLTTIAWVFFRAATLNDAFTMLGKPFLGFGDLRADILEALLQPTLFNVLSQVGKPTLTSCVVLIALLAVVFFTKNTKERIDRFQTSVWTVAKTAVLLAVSALSFTTMTSFIYGGF